MAGATKETSLPFPAVTRTLRAPPPSRALRSLLQVWGSGAHLPSCQPPPPRTSLEPGSQPFCTDHVIFLSHPFESPSQQAPSAKREMIPCVDFLLGQLSVPSGWSGAETRGGRHGGSPPGARPPGSRDRRPPPQPCAIPECPAARHRVWPGTSVGPPLLARSCHSQPPTLASPSLTPLSTRAGSSGKRVPRCGKSRPV